MKNASFHILRVGTAVTFLWIGILILKEPASWAVYIQSWVADISPFSLTSVMVATALLNLFVGILLLLNYKAWVGAFLGSLHLILIITVVGINSITIRDIGLLAATLAIFVSSVPPKFLNGWCAK